MSLTLTLQPSLSPYNPHPTTPALTLIARSLPAQSFTVGTTGSTLGDFAGWLEGVLGVNTEPGIPGTPGVDVEAGALVIRGNAGEQNNFEISGNDITSENTTTTVPCRPAPTS